MGDLENDAEEEDPILVEWDKACALLSDEKYDEAFQTFSSLAEADVPEARTRVGWMHLHGLGTDRDYAAARAMLQPVAESGSISAQHYLGCVCINQLKYEEAITWLERASAAGHLGSTHTIGHLYLKGVGCDKDLGKGLEYFRLAGEKGYISSLRQLVLYDLHGNNGPLGIIRGCFSFVVLYFKALSIARQDPEDDRITY